LGSRIVLLPGHGKTARDFYRSSRTDWLEYAFTCMDDICRRYKKVFLIGHSMGGLLCLNYAFSHKVAGIVLINTPSVIYLSASQVMRSVKVVFSEVERTKILEEGVSVGSGKFYEYPLFAKPFADTCRLTISTKKRLSEITAPVLIIQSRHDETVGYKSAGRLKARLTNTAVEMVYLDHSSHAIFSPGDEDMMFYTVTNFLRRS